jgi:hypothetical protein
VSDNSGDVIGGFAVGVVVASFIIGVFIDDKIEEVNLPAIQNIIAKCPNEEYERVDIMAIAPSVWHQRTSIICKDGSVIVMRVSEIGKGGAE